LESVLGCEGKIISEVLVSGFEGEKKNLRVLCCLGCGGKAENCVIEEEEEEEEEE
jgi:hypothetical protein